MTEYIGKNINSLVSEETGEAFENAMKDLDVIKMSTKSTLNNIISSTSKHITLTLYDDKLFTYDMKIEYIRSKEVSNGN